jgi:hypothetical protein
MDSQSGPLVATLPVPAIECDYLDGENADWARRYVDRCRSKLEGLEDRDSRYEAYLRAEIAAYEDLLRRFKKLG